LEVKKMNRSKFFSIMVIVSILFVCAPSIVSASPIGTAFTYQGRLIDANQAANGLYDFQFKLYDANSGGSKMGADVNIPEVEVLDGYFTVELDFNGPGIFDGDALWLQTGVRPGDLNDPNGYTVLSPRQRLAATPYALSVRAPLSVMQSSADPILGAVNMSSGFGVAGAAGARAGVFGIHVSTGNYGFLGDANAGVCGFAGAGGNAGLFKGNVTVTDGNLSLSEQYGTVYFLRDVTETIDGSLSCTVMKDMDTTVAGAETRMVSKSQSITVGKSVSLETASDWSVNASGSGSITAGQSLSIATSMDLVMDAANDVNIVAGDTLFIDVGSAETVWKKGGNINFTANNVFFDVCSIAIGVDKATEKLDVDGTARLRQITTGMGTALFVDSSGVIYKSVSSRRYKRDIENFAPDANAVMELQPVRFRYKGTGQRDIGLIAEDVADKINDLVIYDDLGRPEAVKYDKISLYLLSVVKNQQEENELLKTRVQELESKIDQLLNAQNIKPVKK
jgi:hypothetical protein